MGGHLRGYGSLLLRECGIGLNDWYGYAASLQAYAKAKEDEIRGVCSSNYQEFVDSIEEIVRMKADVAKLQVHKTAQLIADLDV